MTFTPEQTEAARRAPRVGDVWAMNPGGEWKREITQVDVDGVWFDSAIGREWLTGMCDTIDEWVDNLHGCTLIRRGE